MGSFPNEVRHGKGDRGWGETGTGTGSTGTGWTWVTNEEMDR